MIFVFSNVAMCDVNDVTRSLGFMMATATFVDCGYLCPSPYIRSQIPLVWQTTRGKELPEFTDTTKVS